MDKFRAMATFVQIAEQGSLTAAARVLGSSLPAVVRSLAAFEATLGVRLFNRTTRRISLTDEGRQHLDTCRQLLGALEEAEQALNAEASAPAGHLAITAPVLFGQMHVAPAVTRFVQRHPHMRCSLLLLDRVVDLLEEGVDLGVRIGALKDSSLVALPVGQMRRVVVASPALLRRLGTPQHPRDLAGVPCVRNRIGPASWGPFHEGGRTFNVKVDGPLEFNLVGPAVDACAAGAGFGMFFSYQVEPMLQRGKLQLVLERFEPPPRPIQIVYPHARLLPGRTRVFIDWMHEELKGFRP